eukprot:TRINITY_DN59192_c0_g1_i1.p1 TRINITY_DN59192_c0_g1~~TRINITY_DN59192_c0_g1_i1.p1  ORF type:complete len:133 (-),score=37.16 TRINITY_DN59192_c0_g1_i1:54-452(-)
MVILRRVFICFGVFAAVWRQAVSQEIDDDEDGAVTRAEGLLGLADKDKNGYVSYDEWVGLLDTQFKPPGEDAKKQEHAGLYNAVSKAAKRTYAKADKDGDKRITVEEMGHLEDLIEEEIERYNALTSGSDEL